MYVWLCFKSTICQTIPYFYIYNMCDIQEQPNRTNQTTIIYRNVPNKKYYIKGDDFFFTRATTETPKPCTSARARQWRILQLRKSRRDTYVSTFYLRDTSSDQPRPVGKRQEIQLIMKLDIKRDNIDISDVERQKSIWEI